MNKKWTKISAYIISIPTYFVILCDSSSWLSTTPSWVSTTRSCISSTPSRVSDSSSWLSTTRSWVSTTRWWVSDSRWWVSDSHSCISSSPSRVSDSRSWDSFDSDFNCFFTLLLLIQNNIAPTGIEMNKIQGATVPDLKNPAPSSLIFNNWNSKSPVVQFNLNDMIPKSIKMIHSHFLFNGVLKQ